MKYAVGTVLDWSDEDIEDRVVVVKDDKWVCAPGTRAHSPMADLLERYGEPKVLHDRPKGVRNDKQAFEVGMINASVVLRERESRG